MATKEALLVSETFLSVQGEGPSSGVPAFFIRLGTCNLACRWCDTPYTWAFDERHAAQHISGKQYDPQIELKRVPIEDLVREARLSPTRLCIVTGGEPLLQLEGVSRLLSGLLDRQIEIETAGTLSPGILSEYRGVHFNVSPKLRGSGNPTAKRYKPEILLEFASLAPRTTFKFAVDVTNLQDELAEIEEICGSISYSSPFLMPVATTQDALSSGLRRLIPEAAKRGWRVSNRMHIQAFGDVRGT